jgi:hypothetical protein
MKDGIKLSTLPRKLATIVAGLFLMVVAAGCASTEITSRDQVVTERLPKPARIWVHDFAATAADVPEYSALAGQQSEGAAPQTAEQMETGRQLGAQIASELVAQIRSMGLPAEQAVAGTEPQINDIVLRGYLISFEEGSAVKRVAIGFGSGGSELKVAVEAFQMTAQGLRKLGSGTTASGGGKGPGGALGAATLIATHNPAGLIISTGVKAYNEKSGSAKIDGRAKETAKEIADVLKGRFEEEGWI